MDSAWVHGASARARTARPPAPVRTSPDPHNGPSGRGSAYYSAVVVSSFDYLHSLHIVSAAASQTAERGVGQKVVYGLQVNILCYLIQIEINHQLHYVPI